MNSKVWKKTFALSREVFPAKENLTSDSFERIEEIFINHKENERKKQKNIKLSISNHRYKNLENLEDVMI